MKRYLDDPVLNLTASALRIFRWILIAFGVIAMLASIAIAVAAFLPGKELIEPGKEYVVVLMPAGAVALFLMARFLRLLRELILSVRDSQPLTIMNASRLRSMGWLTLAVQVIMVVAGTAVAWREGPFDFAYDLIETLLIAAVLFILARVFEQGAAMQEELEGTV